MNDVIVLGGGPSGIAAAAYSIQLGLTTVLISPDLGGKLNQTFSLPSVSVSDTIRGASTVRSLAAHLPLDCHIATKAVAVRDEHDHIVVTLADGRTITGQTLIFAAGVQARKLYIPGEKQLQGKGLSYSAVSHAALCGGCAVAIIGNHHRAHSAVLTLSRVAREVLFIVPPGSSPDTLNDDFLRQVAQAQNVTMMTGWELSAIEGRDYVKRLVFHNADGNHRHIPVDALFIELQVLPNTEMVAHLVERDEDGHIKVNQRCATSHPHIFAAGDVTDVYSEQVPVAIGEGIKAALSVSDVVGFRSAVATASVAVA